ncbi:FecR domain-containing protein [Dyadobacter sp. CY345]|uniref:FecR family protein n=1 Tax=Dyadobacter sp. CY345 TaxID=2909335 RepID=UPI001F2EAE48|nr:FecR family protein [Dyadobacter sp. CY345]MCF2443563.1 FecR domain-containing protein [Dyadobacter sp. CY345]
MEENYYVEFLERYIQNQHTPEEHELFLKWFNSISSQQAQQVVNYYAQIAGRQPDFSQVDENTSLIKNIEDRIDQIENPAGETETKVFGLWSFLRRFSAAAVIVLIGIGSYYIFLNKTRKPEIAKQQIETNDAAPGGNKAMLTLSDGSKINLNEADAGQIASQSGIKINKVTDGQLVYAKQGANISADIETNIFNQITTPKAGQYQINLSDGTKVWLNSLSSIRFPAVFNGEERKVEITGEVYFEVASYRRDNRKIPFLVVCNNQVIEVLGTHFNVNSYRDEAVVKTTLLEGSVKVYPLQGSAGKVGQSVKLKPGEQSIVKQSKSNTSGIAVEKVDIESAIAWQKGFFKFKDTNIQEVMRQLSRWYDLDVVYNGPLPEEQFTGYVSKKVAVSNVLAILEEGGGVKFSVKDKKVEVMAAE